MKQMFMAIAACAALGGCVGSQQLVYARIDGKDIPINSPAEASFMTTRTICAGEMSKANISGGPAMTGDIAIDLPNGIDRENDKIRIMEGCMAAHGYKVVPFKPTA